MQDQYHASVLCCNLRYNLCLLLKISVLGFSSILGKIDILGEASRANTILKTLIFIQSAAEPTIHQI